MLFIWKQFLSDTHLPGIIFHEDFIEKIGEDPEDIMVVPEMETIKVIWKEI